MQSKHLATSFIVADCIASPWRSGPAVATAILAAPREVQP